MRRPRKKRQRPKRKRRRRRKPRKLLLKQRNSKRQRQGKMLLRKSIRNWHLRTRLHQRNPAIKRLRVLQRQNLIKRNRRANIQKSIRSLMKQMIVMIKRTSRMMVSKRQKMALPLIANPPSRSQKERKTSRSLRKVSKPLLKA